MRDDNRAIGIGLHDDHNAGVAAVSEGRVLLYSEMERHTRKKNQDGWWADIVAGELESLPLERIGAVNCPRPDLVTELFQTRLGARVLGDGRLDLGGHPIELSNQDDLHPQLHFLSTLVMPEVEPGVYIVMIFDAAQPQIGWVDLTEPLTTLPDLHLVTDHDRRWYVGDIFATLFGKIFYDRASLESCGKLMGLAGWGRVSVGDVEGLRGLALRHFDAEATSWQAYERATPRTLRDELRRTLDVDPLDHTDNRTLDLAAAAQELFRHELLTQVERGLERVEGDLREQGLPAPRGVLYAGGCALSVVTNRTIRRVTGLPLIAPPFSHDAGQFVGGAVYAELRSGAGPVPVGQGWPGLPCHSTGRIGLAEIRAANLVHRASSTAEVASLLDQGRILGCVTDGAEAGPRALGNRSLLANPCHPGIRDRLNNDVKRREWYRPFAPMVAAHAFERYFSEPASHCARYMLDSFYFAPSFRESFAAVSSPDGLTRAQAVDAETSPWLHALLREMEGRNGHPMVLNTSLNAPGLPIAHDLEQVVEDCRVLGLDGIVFHGAISGGRPETIMIELTP